VEPLKGGTVVVWGWAGLRQVPCVDSFHVAAALWDKPVTGAQTPNTTAAYKRINGRTFVVMGKVDGKPTVTTKVVASAGGKSLTATQTGKNGRGENVNNVIVAEKG
jgi:hypothetical protein